MSGCGQPRRSTDPGWRNSPGIQASAGERPAAFPAVIRLPEVPEPGHLRPCPGQSWGCLLRAGAWHPEEWK